MAKTKNPLLLRRKDRVRAATDLRGVPAGTPGKVIVANGIDWIRYWVKFDNGTEVGSLHRDKLVRFNEWDTYLKQQEERAVRAAATAAAGGGAGAAVEAAGADAGTAGGAVTTPNGVTIPPILVERTKNALARFGVTR
jgi:hypothetical protein